MTPRLSVTIAGVTLANPIVTASGAFGFGREYATLYPLSELGAVSAKAISSASLVCPTDSAEAYDTRGRGLKPSL